MIGSLPALLRWCLLLLAVGGGVLGSDVNWGKKVSCFVVDGTVVCPGCNYRAGLACPRKLKDSQNCLSTSTTQYQTSTTKANLPEKTPEDADVTEPTPELLEFNLTTPKKIEIQKEPTKTPLDMAIYLYRLLDSKLPYNRYKREVVQQEELKQEEEELESCNWNGDCPCPLVCCKTGPGCPKKCVMGIRLPPPWG